MEEQQMGELFWEIHGGNRGEGHRDFEPMKSAFDAQGFAFQSQGFGHCLWTGTQTIDLDHLTNGTIIAIDNCQE